MDCTPPAAAKPVKSTTLRYVARNVAFLTLFWSFFAWVCWDDSLRDRRETSNFVDWSLWLFLPLVLCLIVLGFIGRSDNPKVHRLLVCLSAVLGAALATGLIAELFSWAFLVSGRLVTWTVSTESRSWRGSAGVLLLLALAAGLFTLRLRCRAIYGFSEIAVGVGIGASRLLSLKATESVFDSNTILALLTASIYLIVRGLDNVHVGLTKEPVDGLGVGVIRWLRTIFKDMHKPDKDDHQIWG